MDPLEKISTPATETFRAFFAVEVGAECAITLQAIFCNSLQSQLGASWRAIPPANYHITLAFLGKQPAGMIAEFESVLRNCQRQPAFTAQLSAIDFLNRKRRDLLAALLTGDGASQLQALHSQLRTSLPTISSGTSGEHYRPHITLARLNRAARRGAAQDVSALLPLPVSLPGLEIHAVTLFESQLRPQGSHYQPLSRIRLED